MALPFAPQQRDPMRAISLGFLREKTDSLKHSDISMQRVLAGGRAEQSEVESVALHRTTPWGSCFLQRAANKLATRHLQRFQEPPGVRYQRTLRYR